MVNTQAESVKRSRWSNTAIVFQGAFIQELEQLADNNADAAAAAAAVETGPVLTPPPPPPALRGGRSRRRERIVAIVPGWVVRGERGRDGARLRAVSEEDDDGPSLPPSSLLSLCFSC